MDKESIMKRANTLSKQGQKKYSGLTDFVEKPPYVAGKSKVQPTKKKAKK